jgi:5'-phosphate synthase pdxT subunit
MKIGILALQGAVQEHERALDRLGAAHVQVRLPMDLAGLAGLILPGGESTAMARYLEEYGLGEEIRNHAARGMALFGICAGAILICTEVDGRAGALGLLPASARRNAYGRQLSSFEETLETRLGRFHGIFIRAPRLEARAGSEVLAYRVPPHEDDAVLLRSGKVLGATFHPELTGDDRLHQYFLDLAATGA